MRTRYLKGMALVVVTILAASCSKEKKEEDKSSKKTTAPRESMAQDEPGKKLSRPGTEPASARTDPASPGADPAKKVDAPRVPSSLPGPGSVPAVKEPEPAPAAGAPGAPATHSPVAKGGKGKMVLLRMRLKKGKTYKVYVETDQIIHQTMQGKEMETKQQIGFGFDFTTLDVARNGNMKVKVTYNTIRFRMRNPMGATVLYDSTKPDPPTNPMVKGFAGLKGQSFQVSFTPMGSVLEISGLDTLITNIIKSLKLPPGPKAKMAEDQLKKQFGNEAMKEMMENMMSIYPKNKVGVGSTWSKRVVVKSGFPLIMDSTYKLTAYKGENAVLDVMSKVYPNPKGKPLFMGPVSMRYALGGTQKGTSEVSTKTGMSAVALLHQQMAGSMHLKTNEGKSMTMPMRIKSTVRYKPIP